MIFEGPGDHRRTTTTRKLLEQSNYRNVTTRPNLQDATEHLLQYGALLRVHILDTFGKLVYDKYDDFGINQIESLYRIYHDTLERKYNIFDIVPSVLLDGDTRPTKICRHINKYVHTCLQESSLSCAKIAIHNNAHENEAQKSALIVTRRIYQLAEIPKSYPKGFSLDAVLQHLKAGRLRLTPALFSGLLHNVQYDNFDDKVRRSERELVKYLRTAPDTWKIPHQFLMVSTKVSELLKNYLSAGSKLFPEEKAVQAAYLSKHVVREIDAVSKNIELLGIVYDNSTINLDYLFNLVLPKDILDQDVLEARNYLVRKLKSQKIVERYLSIDKYQQNAPDQLVLDILGQLREIHFADDLVASLYIHASYWHKSNMIETLEELLELFDAYENLRTIKTYQGVFKLAEQIKRDLRRAKNVSIEISCSRPRECLRIGLQILANCMIIKENTRRAIASFIQRTTWGCSIQMDDISNETQSIVEHSADLSESAEVSMEKAQFAKQKSLKIANETPVTLPQTTTESAKSVHLDYSQSEYSSSSEHEDSSEIEVNEQMEQESSEKMYSTVTESTTTTTPKPFVNKIIQKTVKKVAADIEAASDLCKTSGKHCSETICNNGKCRSNKIEKRKVEVEEFQKDESDQSESYEANEKAEESKKDRTEIVKTVSPSTVRVVELTTARPIPTSTQARRTTAKEIYIICNNSDPHHQRKLHRLRKVRLVDALHSKSSVNPNIVEKILKSINDKSRPMTPTFSDVERTKIIESLKGSPDLEMAGLKVVSSQRRNVPKGDSVMTDLEKINWLRKKGQLTESQLEELREITSSGKIVHKTKSTVGKLERTNSEGKNDPKTKSTIEELEEIRLQQRNFPKSSPSSRTMSMKRTSWTSKNSDAADRNTARSKEMIFTEGNAGPERITMSAERPGLKSQKWETTSYEKRNFGGENSRITGDNRKPLKSNFSYETESPSRLTKGRKGFRQEEHVVWSGEPSVRKTIKPSQVISSKGVEPSENTDRLRMEASEVWKKSGKTSDRTKSSPGKNVERISIEDLEVSGNNRKLSNPEEEIWSSGPRMRKIMKSRHRFSSDPNKPLGNEYETTNRGNKVLQTLEKTSYGMKEGLGGSTTRRGVYMRQLDPTDIYQKSSNSDNSYQIENPSELAGEKKRMIHAESMVWSGGPTMKKVMKSSRKYSYGSGEPSGESNEMRKQGNKLGKTSEKSSSQLYTENYDIIGNNRKSVKSSVSLENPGKITKEGQKFRREEHTVWSDGPIVRKTMESRRRVSIGATEPRRKTHGQTGQGNELSQHSEKSIYAMKDLGGETSLKYESDKHPSQIETGSKGFRKEERMAWSSGPIVRKTMRSRSRYSHSSDDDPLILNIKSSKASGADHMANESSRKLAITENNGMSNGMKTIHSRRSKTIRGTKVTSGSDLENDGPNPMSSRWRWDLANENAG